MKKYLLILFTVLLTTSIYAQKRMYVYNFSSYDVYMSYFYTIPNLDTDFGITNITTEQPLIFEAGQSYSYVSTFPNPSPNSFPFTGFSGMTWRWNINGAISTGKNGLETELLNGTGQKFYFMKVSGDTNGYDYGNLGQPYGVSQSFISGDNVDFYFVENHISPTEIEYTIMMLDN